MHGSIETIQNPALVHERKRPNRFLAGCLAISSFLLMNGDVKLPDVIEMHHEDVTSDIEDSMTVMTSNVHGWKTADGKNNFDIFLDKLQTEDPDIACLQEVLADGPELRELYDEGYNVLFATTIWYPIKGRFGNAVISQSSIDLKHVVDLPNPTTVTPRNALIFNVETADGEVDMFNVHLSIDSSEAIRQVNHLSAKEGKKVQIACGDFNQQPKTIIAGPFGRMASPRLLKDEVLTFPAHNPIREIDYILPGCGTINNRETRTTFIGSDHLALIEEIDISDCIE